MLFKNIYRKHLINKLRQQTESLAASLEKSDTGHLPLKERVGLMKMVDDPTTVCKIFFECVKKVYPVWNDEFPDNDLMIDLLNKINSYLYQGTGNKKDFEGYYDKYLNYFESIDNKSSLVGLAGIALCYNITYDATTMLKIDGYKGEDDGGFDYDMWNPDFLASMAYAGGNPFLGEGSKEKRKEFWLWYLDVTNRLSSDPASPVAGLPSAASTRHNDTQPTITRIQTYKTDAILDKLKEIVSYANSLVLKQEGGGQWLKIEIETCCIRSGISSVINFYNKEGSKTKISNIDYYPDFSTISRSLDAIKEEMYKQNPEEGGWIMSELTVNHDNTYSVSFNYDDYDSFTKRVQNPANLVQEFEAHPRSKEFTPGWWQKILGKKAAYLK